MAMISCLLFFAASPTLPLPLPHKGFGSTRSSVISASHQSRKESSRLVLKAKAKVAADSNSSTPKTSKKSAENADATSFKALYTDDFYHSVARLDVFRSIAPSVSNNIEDPREKAAKAAVNNHFNGIIKEVGYLCAYYLGMKEECSDVEEGGDDLE